MKNLSWPIFTFLKEKIDDFYNLCFYTIVNKHVACTTNMNMKPTIKPNIRICSLFRGYAKVYANNHDVMPRHATSQRILSKQLQGC